MLATRENKMLTDLYFGLGEDHPFCRITPTRLPEVRRSYAWYLRVPDLPGFLRHIAPALERRLAQSLAAGHTGELKLNFYREGLRLAFEGGRLAAIEPWSPEHADDGSAGFPGQTFLQILFGYRSLDALRGAFPTAGAMATTRVPARCALSEAALGLLAVGMIRTCTCTARPVRFRSRRAAACEFAGWKPDRSRGDSHVGNNIHA